MDDDTNTDRLAGVLWTRDQFANFWPCAAGSVPSLAKRHRITRVGYDATTGQGTYWAVDVVTAYGSRPKQGQRRDIRDDSLANGPNPFYQLGRAIGAAIIKLYSPHDLNRGACDRIQENGGYLTPPLLARLHEELKDTASPLRGFATRASCRSCTSASPL